MTENRTKALVEQALARLYKPYGENVTDEVLEVIENTPPLLAEYRGIAEGFEDGTDSVNQNIGHFVKEVTGRRVLREGVPCERNDLAKTYTKLVE
ncbi:MAG: hypothetical protein OXC14_05440 [Rhodospirillaceae bacterium]|nr:hypothetical protein [Rhodospirillaceae bacterium]